MTLGALAAGNACPSLQQFQGIVDPTDPCQMGGGGSTVVTLDPATGLSTQTMNTLGAPSFGAVDWSNPNATVSTGDIMPTGDTYAGPITTVGQIQSALGIGVAPKSVGIPSWALLGLVAVAFVMIAGGRR